MSGERTLKFSRQNTTEDKEYRDLIQMVFDSSSIEPRGSKENRRTRRDIKEEEKYAESKQKVVNRPLSEKEGNEDITKSYGRRISDTLAISEEVAQVLFKSGPFYISSPMKEILKDTSRSCRSAMSMNEPSPKPTEVENMTRDSPPFLRKKIESLEIVIGQVCTDIRELKTVTSCQVVESRNVCSAVDGRSAQELQNNDLDTLRRKIVNIRKTMEQAQTDLNELERIISTSSSEKSTSGKLRRYRPIQKK